MKSELTDGRGVLRERMVKESRVERVLSKRVVLELVAPGDLGPHRRVVGVPGGEALLLLGVLGREVAVVVVRQHLTNFAEIAGRDLTLVIEKGYLGIEVVVTIVTTPAGVEVDVHLGDLADHAVIGVVGDLPNFRDVYLSAVGSSDQGHLLRAARVGEVGREAGETGE